MQIKEFHIGGMGAFDNCCALILNDLKKIHSDIKIVLVLAYLNGGSSCDDRSKLYDESIYPPLEKVPLRFAISKRNEWMVKNSNFVLFYVNWSWGGAFKTMEMAKKSKVNYENIGELEFSK